MASTDPFNVIVQPKPRVHRFLHGSEQICGSGLSISEEMNGGAINQAQFYGTYIGHEIPHLQTVESRLRGGQGGATERSAIFLCGDSSLDNKYWLRDLDQRPAVNGYQQVLSPPLMKPDIAYWFNKECVDRGVGETYFAINSSVEESTLADRNGDQLLAQDAFIRDHLREQDILVVSVGGNDVALRPNKCTIASIAALLYSPRFLIRWHWAPGFTHFVNMFKSDTERLIEKVASKQKPKCVVVCMYYYFDEQPGGSWADFVLEKLGYNADPSKLQLVMRTVFEKATQNIKLDGVRVVPMPLYLVLDGKNPADYVQRVEPSAVGGEKLAKFMLSHILAD
jgi:hypothetical protein